MNHFLWIEDFDNTEVESLSRNVFSEILSEFYDPKILGNIGRNKGKIINGLSKYGVFIKSNFEDGLNYIRKDLSNIDFIIMDINLPAKKEDSKEVEEFLINFYDDKLKYEVKYNNFVLNSGFYLFTELVCELGFPKKNIIFYSNHGNDQDIIKNKFKEAGIALPEIYIKGKEEDKKIKEWVKTCHENPYTTLRRGVIEGCNHLKELNENKYYFNDFIKDPKKHVSHPDKINYVEILKEFLPLVEPKDKKRLYKLFVRTLVHEWDVCSLSHSDRKNKHSISTFVQTMTMVRNWVSHDKLLEPINEEIISFLFIVNMRAMFNLGSNTQDYEKELLKCISKSQFSDILEKDIKNAENGVNKSLDKFSTVFTETYDENLYFHLYYIGREKKIDKLHFFNQKINFLYKNKQEIELKHKYEQLLLQYFFVSHLENESDWLENISNPDDFLPTLARHIYPRSFS